MTITLSGPDADRAFAELISTIQYDKLKVTVKVKARDNGHRGPAKEKRNL